MSFIVSPNKSASDSPLVPSDTADLAGGPYFISVDTTGVYKLGLANDATGTGGSYPLAANVLYQYLVRRIFVTGSPGSFNAYGCTSVNTNVGGTF